MPDGVALLICAHGAHGGPGVAAIHADALRRRRVVAEIAACCLKGHPSIGQALAELSASAIVVVPLLMADGYVMRTLLPLAVQDAAEDRGGIILCPPIGTHSGLPDIIRARAAHACRCRGWATEETALVLVGHGTSRNVHSPETAHRLVAAIRHLDEFADVDVAFLEASPTVLDALDRCGHRNVVVVGLFADRGMHGEADVLHLLAPLAGSVVYDGPIGAAPEIAGVILAQARLAMFDLASAPRGGARRAPIRMCAAAPHAT